MVRSVSARLPASIQAPTVAVCAAGFDSVATVRPLASVVVCVMGWSEAESVSFVPASARARQRGPREKAVRREEHRS